MFRLNIYVIVSSKDPRLDRCGNDFGFVTLGCRGRILRGRSESGKSVGNADVHILIMVADFCGLLGHSVFLLFILVVFPLHVDIGIVFTIHSSRWQKHEA